MNPYIKRKMTDLRVLDNKLSLHQWLNNLHERNENYSSNLFPMVLLQRKLCVFSVSKSIIRFIKLKRKIELTWGRTGDGLNLWRQTKGETYKTIQGVS